MVVYLGGCTEGGVPRGVRRVVHIQGGGYPGVYTRFMLSSLPFLPVLGLFLSHFEQHRSPPVSFIKTRNNHECQEGQDSPRT